MRTFVRLLFLEALILAALSAQQALAQSHIELGPKDGNDLPPANLDRIKIGSEAPDFSLEDQDGRVITLSDFRNKKAVVLVFYRGKW